MWRVDILDNLGCYASVAGRLKETKVLRSAIDRDEEIRGLALRGRVAAFVAMDRKSAADATRVTSRGRSGNQIDIPERILVMGFRLEKDEKIGSGFQRILVEQAARLSEDLAAADQDPEKAIHEVRKRCKRVRAVARLLRPNAKALYRQENAAFRDMARGLSPFRDADVRLETFDDLVSRTDRPERLPHFGKCSGKTIATVPTWKNRFPGL